MFFEEMDKGVSMINTQQNIISASKTVERKPVTENVKDGESKTVAGTSFSNNSLYLNKSQNQIYTGKKLNTLFHKWNNELQSGKRDYSTFMRLSKEHFENLKTLPRFETIESRNHSVQCSYALDHNCHCWCAGKYHGSKLKGGRI